MRRIGLACVSACQRCRLVTAPPQLSTFASPFFLMSSCSVESDTQVDKAERCLQGATHLLDGRARSRQTEVPSSERSRWQMSAAGPGQRGAAQERLFAARTKTLLGNRFVYCLAAAATRGFGQQEVPPQGPVSEVSAHMPAAARVLRFPQDRQRISQAHIILRSE